MSISGWFKGGAERRAAALVQARVNREPLGREALGDVGPELIVALGRVLGEADERRRRAGVEVLALTGAPAAVPVLVAALERSDVWLRGAIARAIQQLDAPAEVLAPFASSPSPAARAAVLPALSRLPSGPAWVTQALSDAAPEVRIGALALVDADDFAPVEALMEDPDLEVRAHAANALHRHARTTGAQPSPQAIEVALALLDQPAPARESAARLLGLAPEPRVIDALAAAGEQGNLEALRALGRIGGSRSFPVLVRALNQPGCTGVAAEALAELGDPLAISAIEAALAQLPVEVDPPDTPSDRSAALKALDALRRAARP